MDLALSKIRISVQQPSQSKLTGGKPEGICSDQNWKGINMYYERFFWKSASFPKENWAVGRVSWCPVVRTRVLSLLWPWAQSLVRELRSSKPRSMAEKGKTDYEWPTEGRAEWLTRREKLDQESAELFSKGPDRKYFRFIAHMNSIQNLLHCAFVVWNES